MKKYLLKVALFLALAALTDLAAGLAFAGLRRAARSGQTEEESAYYRNLMYASYYNSV